MTDCGGSVHRWIAPVLLASAALTAAVWATPAHAVGSDATDCYAFSDTIAPLDGNAPTFSFVDISATGSELSLFDGQVSSAIAIGFGFNFYCVLYWSVFVLTNGFVSFVGSRGS